MVAQETDEELQFHGRRINETHQHIAENLENAQLDALIVVGDDQDEAFTAQTFFPQLAIYTGPDYRLFRRPNEQHKEGEFYKGYPAFAEHLLTGVVNAGFDVVDLKTLPPDGLLRTHSISPVVDKLAPNVSCPVIPIFVEGIHMPAPSPRRCYEFGKALAAAIESWPGDEKIGVIASGGLSHVTQGYPYASAPTVSYGNIHVDFDRAQVERMASGRGAEMAELTNEDLLANGDVEMRSWITVMGMIGGTKADVIVYEPSFRSLMGMAAAYWDPQKEMATSR